MGHTGISVNIMLSRPDREDICDREIPSHGRGGGRRNRRGGCGCDLHCICYHHVASGSAGRFQRATAPGSGRARRRYTYTRRVGRPPQQPAGPERVRSPARATWSRAESRVQGYFADQELQKAAARGSLPLTFNITNIAPAGPGAASANITASGPHLAPTTENITFVDQGGWKLSRTSAMTLIQSVQSAGG